MKLAWIRWTDRIEMRDDGYTIYHNAGFVMLRRPDGSLIRYPSAEEAKRVVDDEVMIYQKR